MNSSIGTLKRRPPAPQRDGVSAVGGCAFKGGSKTRTIVALGGVMLPEYPGTRIVPVVHIPTHASLHADQDAYERVGMLATAYREVHGVRFTRSFFMSRGRLGVHKRYNALLFAADALLSLKIPPTAWVLYSFDAWAYVAGPKRAPPPGWVYGAKRIGNAAGWFQPAYRGTTRVQVGKLHGELLAKHQAMWVQLRQLNDPTKDDVLAVVDQFFPGESYENEVAAARTEVVRLQRKASQRVAEGLLWNR